MATTTVRDFIQLFASWRLWATPLLLSVILIVVAQYDFLIFHTLAELFAIVISFIMFAFAWLTYDFSKNSFLLFLACGYFWIGSLDLMHTASYKGMNLFAQGTANTSTQFWIGTRYAEALLLLVAPVFARREHNKYVLFLVFGVVAVGLSGLILSGHFPTSYIEGVGLTPFKVNSEYVIDVIFFLALLVLFSGGRDVPSQEKLLIAAAIVMTMCAELAFTFYVGVYDFSNLAGHIFKLFSFWFIFRAIVIYNLKMPYADIQDKLSQINTQERRFEGMFNAISDGIVLADAQRRIIAANKGMTSTFGYLESELLGHKTSMIYESLEEFERQGRARFNLSSKELTDPYVVNYRHKDGHIFPGETLGTVIKSANGDFICYMGVMRDISKRRHDEEQLREAKEEAEKANTAKSEFLASMSHELRTPLNAVLGFAQMMQYDPQTPLSPTQRGYADSIVKGGEHLLELVNGILDLAQVEADQLDLDLRDVEANEVVAECVMLATPLGKKRGIKIDDQFSGGPASHLHTDKVRLKQILINLVFNAVKFNTDGGTVTVFGHETNNGFLRISVQDTGIGIPKHEHAHIFHLFHRIDADPMVSREGTGIGLAVTKRLVERMAGNIGFESEEGAGSTFWFELPLSSNETALIWTETLRIGVDAIDKDHQSLIMLLNRVSNREIDDADVDQVVGALIDYTHYHFLREEALMEACEYPDLENHRNLHHGLLDEVSVLSRAWKENRDAASLNRLRAFLRNWLFNHILKIDTTISRYARGHEYMIKKALEGLD